MAEVKYTFDMVWQMFAETDKRFAKANARLAETNRIIKENSTETNKKRKYYTTLYPISITSIHSMLDGF